MYFEDARELTLPALLLLVEQREALGCPDLQISSLVDFSAYAHAHKLTRRQKEVIVDQASFLISQFYAHLPFKRARYAADPVQSLRLIRAQLESLSDLAFHEHMLQTMVSLRDAHTFYALPVPYQGAFAFLPFQMRCFYERSGKRRYIVTDVLPGFEHDLFALNAEITSWNGVPVDLAVEREGLHDPGANPSSRLARSLNRMCNRSLALSVPPKESFVVVGYKPARAGKDERADEYGIVMPWNICVNGLAAKKRHGTTSSLNESMSQTAQAQGVLFHRQVLTQKIKAQSEPTPAASLDARHVSQYPAVFSFQYTGGVRQFDSVDPAALQDPAHPESKFGYVRIQSFELDNQPVNAASHFVKEFRRIVELMQEVAPDGLIVDVRSNPGGSIQAAERILQFLTPGDVQPADFHFISSQTTQKIASILQHQKATIQVSQSQWHRWVPGLLDSIANGNAMTPGHWLTPPRDCMDTGQIYQGPVTLIIDALAYSATDIFAAGFQDHKIGKIIGVDENTGGGGANRWLHEELWENLKLHGMHDLPFELLPGGAEMGLAIRRCSRVAKNSGTAIEDEGVRADIDYQFTRNDLLKNGWDLLASACAHLAKQPAYRLKIDSAELKADGFEVTVTTRNLFRLECVVDGRFNQGAVVATGQQQSFKVSIAGLAVQPEALKINGYALIHDQEAGPQLTLAASGRWPSDESAPLPATIAASAR